MSSHSNISEAHAFYYIGVNEHEEHSYSGVNVSYNHNKAYSYSTIVAIVIPCAGYKLNDVNTRTPERAITLVSSNCMSATTARHISDIRGASPFDVVSVPMERGRHELTPGMLANNILSALDSNSKYLNRIEFRREFARLMEARKTIMDRACKEWASAMKDKRFKKFEKLDVEKYAEELKKKKRADAAKEAALSKKLIQKYLGDKHGADYLEFVKTLLCYGHLSDRFPLTQGERSFLRNRFCIKSASYVWLDGDNVKTSKGISIPVYAAKIVMKSWAAGDDMRGVEVKGYRIVKYEGDTIKIGCHEIPRENMLALYEVVMGTPFPSKKEEQNGIHSNTSV